MKTHTDLSDCSAAKLMPSRRNGGSSEPPICTATHHNPYSTVPQQHRSHPLRPTTVQHRTATAPLQHTAPHRPARAKGTARYFCGTFSRNQTGCHPQMRENWRLTLISDCQLWYSSSGVTWTSPLANPLVAKAGHWSIVYFVHI